MDTDWPNAIRRGDINRVKYLIKDGDVNAQGEKYGNALVTAAKNGFKEIVEILIKADANLNAQNGIFGIALHEAVENGRKEIVKILITAGADVNAQGGTFGNALQAAAIYGQKDVVEILMKGGADVNAQGGYFGNALQAAAKSGRKEIVEILIKAGADVNAQGGCNGNALQAAAHSGHKDVVEILMKASADVDAQGGEYGNALQAATHFGHKEIVEILMKAGANVNAQGGNYGNSLQAAANSGHKEIMEILMKEGADVNAQGGYFGNALQAAILDGHKEIVKILMKAGADVNAQGGAYGNALQAAAVDGQKDVVEILIKEGVDVNTQGGCYGNALQAAAHFGHKDVVEILMKAGADVGAQGGEYGNALQAATHFGHKEIVEILMKAGAYVNAQGGHYGNALQAAVSTGQEQIVTLMLQNNALLETESKAKDDWSILHAAVASKNSRILTMLLGSGAGKYLNARNISGQTPIHFAVAIDASELQTVEILQLLKDSDPNTQDIDGQTPLHLAVNAQKAAVVKYLLDLGAIADTPDFGNTTPFELAAQSRNLEILCLIFPKIQDTIQPINASQWRSIAGEERIIKMTYDQHANVEIMDRRQFALYLNDWSYSLSAVELVDKEKSLGDYTMDRQIFILSDEKELGDFFPGVQCRWWRKTWKDKVERWRQISKESIWTAQMNTVPSAVTISQVRSGEWFLECRLALPIFTPFQLRESPEWIKPFRQLKKNYSIIWIMVKPKSVIASSGNRETLVSRTFFSTLEYAAVPNSATDLFVPLVQQFLGEWSDLYTAAEEHQSDMRTRVLVSNGRDSGLIRDLLLDARLWGWLRKLSEGQTLTLRTFERKYRGWTVLHEEGKEETEKKLRLFRREINSLTDQMGLKLKGLEAASQELIQLEFNLTSIAEAQKSTSTNVSMKRLSWITFIFLPLMFISSLFGMNVDILKSNPGWWIYIIFAAGTMILTFGVWILFKRKNLEGRIEKKFQWLVKRKNFDEEKGVETTLEAGTRWTGKAKVS